MRITTKPYSSGEKFMGDLPGKIYGKMSEDLNPFKRILARIPGFSGYMEATTRRVSDKMLREAIAERYEELWGRVSGLQREFIRKGEIAYVDDLEAAAVKLRTFADRIRRASYGYKGLFADVKIEEDELARIYEHDAAMLDMVDEVARAIDHVEASMGTDGLPAAIRNLETVSQQPIELFERREEMILSTGE
jgi:hypothetical protein